MLQKFKTQGHPFLMLQKFETQGYLERPNF